MAPRWRQLLLQCIGTGDSVPQVLYEDHAAKKQVKKGLKKDVKKRPVDQAKQDAKPFAAQLESYRLLEGLRADMYQAYVEGGPCGQRLVTYMDFAASGRPLKSFDKFMQEHVHPTYANTHTEASELGLRTSAMMEQARLAIASAVHAPRDEYAVIFAGAGATNALHLLAHTLLHSSSSQSRAAGIKPVVFIGPYEHHSNEILWREQDCDVMVVGDDEDGHVSLSQLESLLQQQRAVSADSLLIGCFSAGSNVTGVITQVDEISVLMHQYGGLACFDYAAAGSYHLPHMTAAEGANPMAYKDAVCLSPHKLPGGPGASGVLVSRRELFKTSAPPRIPGGGTVVWTSQYGHAFTDDIEAREEGGTPNILANIRTGMAMRLCATVSEHPYIHAHEQALTRLLVESLMAIPGVMVLGADQPGTLDWNTRLGIVSFVVAAPAMLDSLVHDTLRVPSTSLSSGRSSRRSSDRGTGRTSDRISEHSWGSNSPSFNTSPVVVQMLESPSDSESSRRSSQMIPSSSAGSSTGSTSSTPLAPAGASQKLLHHHYVCKLLSDVYGIQARSGCNCAGPYGISLLISMFRSFLAARIGSPDFELPARSPPCCVRNACYHGCKCCQLSPEESYVLEAMGEMGAPKAGWIRLSIKYLNTHDDIKYAVQAVEQIAQEGWRLLPQYRINPESGGWEWLGEDSVKPNRGGFASMPRLPSFKKGYKMASAPPPQQPVPGTYTQLAAMRQQYLTDAQRVYKNAAQWVTKQSKVNQEPWSHPLPADMEIWRWWASPKEAATVMLH